MLGNFGVFFRFSFADLKTNLYGTTCLSATLLFLILTLIAFLYIDERLDRILF